MTSKRVAPREAYVWVWLPGKTEPIVAGRISRDGDTFPFNYGRRYLDRSDAISLYDQEIPLRRGVLRPSAPATMAGCLRDAGPDAWGRRVILNRLTGPQGVDTTDLDDLTYLLESGSDRIGALDFQTSADQYVPREAKAASMEDLLDAADRVEKGVSLPESLTLALFHGTAIGGARPKALVEDGSVKHIAKFSSTTDIYGVVQAEFIAMRLAKIAGLSTAPVRITNTAGRKVLLVERFDREKGSEGWTRKGLISALTLLELDEMTPQYASYAELAEIVRRRFEAPKDTLRELFGRITFNILVGNTDDHAKNHAAFWDGRSLRLTPAYDICPQSRTGGEASQAMLIDGQDRRSRLETCRRAAHHFLLNDKDAVALIEHQIESIKTNWRQVCDEAELPAVDRNLLWGRQFLNPYAFEGFAA